MTSVDSVELDAPGPRSHRLVIGSGAGSCAVPDGLAWEAARV